MAEVVDAAAQTLGAMESKMRGASPDVLAELSSQVEGVPALAALVSQGLLKWKDLLTTSPSGETVVDVAKLQAVRRALARQGALARGQATAQYARYSADRTTRAPTALPSGISVVPKVQWLRSR